MSLAALEKAQNVVDLPSRLRSPSRHAPRHTAYLSDVTVGVSAPRLGFGPSRDTRLILGRGTERWVLQLEHGARGCDRLRPLALMLVGGEQVSGGPASTWGPGGCAKQNPTRWGQPPVPKRMHP